ncbi:TPA: hypothetical protein I7682_18045 [Vibrio vulnificus]|nr:hypothetical protein [Vibrio vulnificus]
MNNYVRKGGLLIGVIVLLLICTAIGVVLIDGTTASMMNEIQETTGLLRRISLALQCAIIAIVWYLWEPLIVGRAKNKAQQTYLRGARRPLCLAALVMCIVMGIA